jgi:hypothetical protein
MESTANTNELSQSVVIDFGSSLSVFSTRQLRVLFANVQELCIDNVILPELKKEPERRAERAVYTTCRLANQSENESFATFSLSKGTINFLSGIVVVFRQLNSISSPHPLHSPLPLGAAAILL